MLSLDLIERNQEAGWYSHGVVFFTCMSSSLWLSSLWAIPPSRGFTVSTWLLCLYLSFYLPLSLYFYLCFFTVFVFPVVFEFVFFTVFVHISSCLWLCIPTWMYIMLATSSTNHPPLAAILFGRGSATVGEFLNNSKENGLKGFAIFSFQFIIKLILILRVSFNVFYILQAVLVRFFVYNLKKLCSSAL